MKKFLFVTTNTFLAFFNIRQLFVATSKNFVATFFMLRGLTFCCDILYLKVFCRDIILAFRVQLFVAIIVHLWRQSNCRDIISVGCKKRN